jgi:hypothetical protein
MNTRGGCRIRRPAGRSSGRETRLALLVLAGAAQALGCGDDGGPGHQSDAMPGFDYAYDYEANFYSDQTGTFIGPDHGPSEPVGRWDETPQTFSRTFHVRPPGATYGSGDGSSWTNAFSGLPEDLVRDAKYYVASGEYYDGPWADRFFQYEFDDPLSGEQSIGIFKAVATDHGSDDGWEASFGEGQARFAPISIITGHLVLDGQVGLGGDDDAYGISISSRDCDDERDGPITFPWNSEATNLSLRHLDVRGCGHRPDPTHGSADAIYSYTTGIDRFALRDSYVHDSFRGLLFLQGSRDVFVEGTTFARAGLHHEAFTIALRDTDDVVLRRNVLIDSYGDFIGLQGTSNVHLYGNVIRRTLPDWPIWAAIFITERGEDILIYNNTFYGLEGLNAGVRCEPEGLVHNLQVVNNLWAGSRVGQIMLHGNHDHNAFYDNLGYDGSTSLDDAIDEPTKQVLAADPFVDGPAGDLRLAGPTAAGTTLASPYDWDLAGTRRGEDGVWDRGAYEYQE